jgi:putative ABC transport system ATP-binding protein
MSPTLSVRCLSHTYVGAGQRQVVLDRLDLDLKASEFLLLCGPSGCGKTTLLTLVGGLRAVQEGSINLLGQELFEATHIIRNYIRSNVGMIFQSHHLISFLTVEENVVVAMDSDVHAIQSQQSKRRRARELLSRLGLEDKLDCMPRQLSGGQKQRVAIARALACQPKLLLADEPTASLDSENGRRIMEQLRVLVAEDGLSILMTSHDQRLYGYSDRVVEIRDGRLVSP